MQFSCPGLYRTFQAPSWAYLQAALGLFIYQTLDATDGKQARRTGSSTPLGELFDHGCDAFSQGETPCFTNFFFPYQLSSITKEFALIHS